MRQKKTPTILERAVNAVPEFEKVMTKMSNQVTLRGQSKSTLLNYTKRIALFVIHFNRLPEQVSEDEINEYSVALARDPKSPSRSSFKHMVYGRNRVPATFLHACFPKAFCEDTKVRYLQPYNHPQPKPAICASTKTYYPTT